MATIVYLDVDDEITSAAARIRTAGESRVGLVLPYGSRVATSRINFRLLAREAQTVGRRLDVIAPDASARALAASAGIPVFASVGEYESAMESEAAGGQDPDGPSAVDDGIGPAERAGGTNGAGTAGSDGHTIPTVTTTGVVLGPGAALSGATAGDGAETSRPAAPGSRGTAGAGVVSPGAPKPSAAGPAAAGAAAAGAATVIPAPPLSRPEPASRRRPSPLLLALVGALALALVAGGVTAYVVLPTAEITVTPRIEALGPISLQVRADPEATDVDVEGAVIPAEAITIPLSASGEFPASGTRVDEARATGTVRFESINTVGPVSVPSGTRLATLDGIVFLTTRAVTVPAARVAGDRIERGVAEAPVRANRPGPEANVGAGSITQVPDVLRTQQVSVGNRGATSGGRRNTFPVVLQRDVDAALQQLRAELDTELATALENPPGVPDGATVFEDTLVVDEPVPDGDPAAQVGREVRAFSLGMTSEARLLAVDSAPVEQIAETRLLGSLGSGYELIDGSVRISVGDAQVTGGVVTFPVVGTAQRSRPVDAESIEAAVLGRNRAEAEQILSQFGAAELVLWPDWVDTVPTLEQRVEVTVRQPAGSGGSGPGPSPSPSPATRSSPSPGTTPGTGEGEPVPSP
jgi:hypothetical protein